MTCQAVGKNQGNVSQVHKIQNPHAKINLLLAHSTMTQKSMQPACKRPLNNELINNNS